MGHYEANYRSLLPADRYATILDIGCGSGDFTRFAHGLGHRNVTAVDQDARAIRELDGLEGVTAVTAKVDAQFLQDFEGRAELIVARQMLYYYDRKEAPGIVTALARALAPSGRLVVEIFNGALLSSRFTELKDPAILTAYTEHGLRRLLEANGLVVEALVGAKSTARGLRSRAYQAARRTWLQAYRQVLILERGLDDELPRIWDKSIIAVARRA
jgi:2-polyprenyl-3-methyl-5-hydroxy-6-metoxy-1,4-benzoquinol methylase